MHPNLPSSSISSSNRATTHLQPCLSHSLPVSHHYLRSKSRHGSMRAARDVCIAASIEHRLAWHGLGADYAGTKVVFTGRRLACRLRPPLQPVCSSRNTGRPRAPLWRGRVLTSESLRAVQDLKRAKGDTERTAEVFRTRISRLLKADLLATLAELQRQDECELVVQVDYDVAFPRSPVPPSSETFPFPGVGTLPVPVSRQLWLNRQKIFNTARKEIWYKPDLILYSDLISTFGRNMLIEEVEKLVAISKEEGLKPDTRFYTEILGAFLRSGMAMKAMQVYEELKLSECSPSELTYAILVKGLERNGEFDLAASVKKEYDEFLSRQSEKVTAS